MALVVDATGVGDAWIDHLVTCDVVPTLAVVVAGLVSAFAGRWIGSVTTRSHG